MRKVRCMRIELICFSCSLQVRRMYASLMQADKERAAIPASIGDDKCYHLSFEREREREREGEGERHGYLISRIRGSLCAPMSRFSTTRLFFPTAICRVLARLRQTKQQTPTGRANSTQQRTAMRRSGRHRKLSGHEKRRYLSNGM